MEVTRDFYILFRPMKCGSMRNLLLKKKSGHLQHFSMTVSCFVLLFTQTVVIPLQHECQKRCSSDKTHLQCYCSMELISTKNQWYFSQNLTALDFCDLSAISMLIIPLHFVLSETLIFTRDGTTSLDNVTFKQILLREEFHEKHLCYLSNSI